MKILILGGTGMIGHRMWLTLKQDHDVWGTVRKNKANFPIIKNFVSENYVIECDNVLDLNRVTEIVQTIRPDYILNCTGIVKQLELSKNHIYSIELNSLFPHKLAAIASDHNARMIQFSTDCVFSGNKGNYKEDDPLDANDLYGKSKYMGEVDYLKNVLTLRLSTIGREIIPHGGLVEWFLAQDGKQVSGYKNAIYSGFPTLTLATIINRYVLPNRSLSGIVHISSGPIGKYDLLHKIKSLLNLNIEIVLNDDVHIDRSLNSSKFRELVGFRPLSWDEMLEDLKVDYNLYNT